MTHCRHGDFHSKAPVGSLTENARLLQTWFSTLFLRILLLERIPGEAPHRILLKENSDELQYFLGCFRESSTEDFWYWGKTMEIGWTLGKTVCLKLHPGNNDWKATTAEKPWRLFLGKGFRWTRTESSLCLGTLVGPLLSMAMHGSGFLSLIRLSLDLGAWTSLVVWVVFSKTACS